MSVNVDQLKTTSRALFRAGDAIAGFRLWVEALRASPEIYAPHVEDFVLSLTFLEVLGISEKESDDRIIKKAFRSVSLVVHPDKVGKMSPEGLNGASALFFQVSLAHETLSDATKRGNYLDSLRKGGAKEAAKNQQYHSSRGPVEREKPGRTLFHLNRYDEGFVGFKFFYIEPPSKKTTTHCNVDNRFCDCSG